MKPYSLLLFVLCSAVAFGQPAFARGKAKIGKAAPKTIVLDIPPVEDKTLESSDTFPKWTKETIKTFCEGRYVSIQQDKKQCEAAHKEDVGHKMTTADMQELKEFKKQAKGAVHAKKAAKKAAGRANKGTKKAAGRAQKKSNKHKDKPAVDSTIVQPPLSSD